MYGWDIIVNVVNSLLNPILLSSLEIIEVFLISVVTSAWNPGRFQAVDTEQVSTVTALQGDLLFK